jgi:hypothetical protein
MQRLSIQAIVWLQAPAFAIQGDQQLVLQASLSLGSPPLQPFQPATGVLGGVPFRLDAGNHPTVRGDLKRLAGLNASEIGRQVLAEVGHGDVRHGRLCAWCFYRLRPAVAKGAPPTSVPAQGFAAMVPDDGLLEMGIATSTGWL